MYLIERLTKILMDRSQKAADVLSIYPHSNTQITLFSDHCIHLG